MTKTHKIQQKNPTQKQKSKAMQAKKRTQQLDYLQERKINNLNLYRILLKNKNQKIKRG